MQTMKRTKTRLLQGENQMKTRMIQVVLAATVLLLAFSGVLLAAGPMGQDFLKNTWATGWESDFDSATTGGSWNLDMGWLGVCWYGWQLPDAVLEKDWTRLGTDTKTYVVNLAMDGHGWYRMHNTGYIDYSLDGGAWMRLASGAFDSYGNTHIAGSIAVGSGVQALGIRYGVVNAGDWIQSSGGSCAITAVSAAFVPEPSSILALLSGCGGLLGIALRRRK